MGVGGGESNVPPATDKVEANLTQMKEKKGNIILSAFGWPQTQLDKNNLAFFTPAASDETYLNTTLLLRKNIPAHFGWFSSAVNW